MNLTGAWARIRKYVPLWAYPLLGPLYRLRRRRQLRRLDALDRALLASEPGLVFPPAVLRYNVVGPCTAQEFRATGEQTLRDVERALAQAGRSLEQVSDFLDFGCGCGRLAIAMGRLAPGVHYTGCDVDARAVSWCTDHLQGQRFIVNGGEPPAPFADASFDVIWCGSVFTHIDETRQHAWLADLKRMLRPPGVLIASVHGRQSWQARLPRWAIRDLERKGFLYAHIGADKGVHPDWYQVAWHTEKYVRERWSEFFAIAGYMPQGFNNHQDLVVGLKN